MSTQRRPPTFGQRVFLDYVEQSDFRQRMARAALNFGGRHQEYPVDLSDMVRLLPWRECQCVLALATLAASDAFEWPESQEALLRQWADHPLSSPSDNF